MRTGHALSSVSVVKYMRAQVDPEMKESLPQIGGTSQRQEGFDARTGTANGRGKETANLECR